MTISDVAKQYIGVVEGSEDHHRIIDEYNTISPLPRGYKVTYDDSWCAVFVSLCAKRAGYLDFPYECGVFDMLNKFIMPYRITPFGGNGDVIFFSYSHMGIIDHIEDNSYITIEGNSMNAVRYQKHPMYARYIRAIGNLPPIINDDIELIARKVIAGKYGNQPEREKLITGEGYNYKEVQELVNSMLNVKL